MGWMPRGLHNLQAKGIVSLVEFRGGEQDPRHLRQAKPRRSSISGARARRCLGINVPYAFRCLKAQMPQGADSDPDIKIPTDSGKLH